MVDNRYATALVIGSVLSLLATVYLSVAVGTQHWYEYNTPEVNNTTHSEPVFPNGTRALWWRCIQVASPSYWFKSPDRKMETRCSSFSLSDQLGTKYKPGNEEEEDLLRTYLWRCQFLLPLVSLALVFLSVLVGVCACLCRSFTPTFCVGVLHLLAGLCSLGTVCCFLAGVDLVHQYFPLPDGVEGTLGWSLYLALISFPLQMMAASLFLWAAKSHRKNYTRMTAYRVA